MGRRVEQAVAVLARCERQAGDGGQTRLPESLKVGFSSLALIGHRARFLSSLGGPTPRCPRLCFGSLGFSRCHPCRIGQLAFPGAELTHALPRLLQSLLLLGPVVAARRLLLRWSEWSPNTFKARQCLEARRLELFGKSPAP